MVQEMKPLFKRVYWHVVPVMAALLLLGIIYFVDTKVFPPLRSFTVTSAYMAGDDLVIKGIMDKRRCSMTQDPKAYDELGDQHPIEFLDRNKDLHTTNRAPLVQSWGPWIVKNIQSINKIDIAGVHRCHVFWDKHTILAEILVNKVQP
jgi:hypothetical protein